LAKALSHIEKICARLANVASDKTKWSRTKERLKQAYLNERWAKLQACCFEGELFGAALLAVDGVNSAEDGWKQVTDMCARHMEGSRESPSHNSIRNKVALYVAMSWLVAQPGGEWWLQSQVAEGLTVSDFQIVARKFVTVALASTNGSLPSKLNAISMSLAFLMNVSAQGSL